MKIFCIGRNYINHAKELNNPVPEEPLIFTKQPTSVLKDNRPFYYPSFSKDVHYECELVLKICKNGKKIEEQFANRYYNEITVGIDFTARDIQSELKAKKHPWDIAKGFDGSAVLGEFIDVETLKNKESIEFSLDKNGETAQNGNSKDVIFSFDYIVSYLSQYFTLQKGDLIFTGTPEGVGPVQIGDALKGSIEGNELFEVEVK